MRKEEHQWLGYKFTNDQPNSFIFRTINKILYEVRFKPSGYIFANEPELEPFVFEMSIVVIDNPTGKRPPGDPLVPPTVAHIFSLFFEQHERVVVYVCDSSDGRGEARQRKFSSWFALYKGSYVQFNDTITDEKGDIYYVSLIMNRNNPHRLRLIVAFNELTMTNSEDK